MPETPRRLMSSLREVMAQGGSTQERLDAIVALIAEAMKADVCSIYVALPDMSLELAATQGLRIEAVHTTKMASGEGLVGLIAKTARPLNLKDAPNHPQFSYRPETGEDPYHGFLGVPVIHSGRVLGVLDVQSQSANEYSEEDVEALQNIAMVLAEIISAHDLSKEDGFTSIAARPTGSARLKGRAVSEGLAIGTAVLHDPIVPAAKFFASDLDGEHIRLSSALKELQNSVDAMMIGSVNTLWGAPRDVLETYRLFANDPSWINRLKEAINAGFTAEAAVDRVRREHRARLAKATDPYLRERLHDLEDLENRLLRILSGEAAQLKFFTEDAIMVARRMGPAELLDYRDSGLKGLLLEEAGASSHAAIIARALEIPTIASTPELLTHIDEGDPIIVDGETGEIIIRPEEEILEAYQQRLELKAERALSIAKSRHLPATTIDGEAIHLSMNAGLEIDLHNIAESGAESVGLFRTEFQFLMSDKMPHLQEQIEYYGKVRNLAGDKAVTFRTIDLGGDKAAPFMTQEREVNPALGWRAIRLALDRPGLLRWQLRALIKATNGGHLRVMFPLVSTIEEFDQARLHLDREIARAKRLGEATPSKLEVGIMVEAPAIIWGLPALKDKIDFVSIGTNDLLQYFYAADRDNPMLADRYDLLSPQGLGFMAYILQTCQDHDIEVHICGEVAGRIPEGLALIGLGYRSLSMLAPRIGRLKHAIRALELKPFETRLKKWVKEGHPNIREEILNLITSIWM